MKRNSGKTTHEILEENKRRYDDTYKDSKQLIPTLFNKINTIGTISPSTQKELYKKFVNKIISLDDNKIYLDKVAAVLNIERKQLDIIDKEDNDIYEEDNSDGGYKLKKDDSGGGYKLKKGGCNIRNIKVTTKHLEINKSERDKIIEDISYFSPGYFLIPLDDNNLLFFKSNFEDKKKRLIIQLNKDKKKELIHISLFPFSNIHVTFNRKNDSKETLKIYQNCNPDLICFFKNIKNLLLRVKHQLVCLIKDIVDDKPYPNIPEIYRNSNEKNNWNSLVTLPKNKAIEELIFFRDNLNILLNSLQFLKDIDPYHEDLEKEMRETGYSCDW
jgi:hypothetical protein